MREVLAVACLALVVLGFALSPAPWLAPIVAGALGLTWALLSDDGKAAK